MSIFKSREFNNTLLFVVPRLPNVSAKETTGLSNSTQVMSTVGQRSAGVRRLVVFIEYLVTECHVCHIPPGTSSPVTAPATKQRQTLLIFTPAEREISMPSLSGPQWSKSKT